MKYKNLLILAGMFTLLNISPNKGGADIKPGQIERKTHYQDTSNHSSLENILDSLRTAYQDPLNISNLNRVKAYNHAILFEDVADTVLNFKDVSEEEKIYRVAYASGLYQSATKLLQRAYKDTSGDSGHDENLTLDIYRRLIEDNYSYLKNELNWLNLSIDYCQDSSNDTNKRNQIHEQLITFRHIVNFDSILQRLGDLRYSYKNYLDSINDQDNNPKKFYFKLGDVDKLEVDYNDLRIRLKEIK